ncbi:MAG: bifunctional indole-3-glycerol-phosphate synthase TrpC/phosphoribosylanthranilate isomerase TrpF [Gammaproteobacteria bacterium]|nr:bifunctional indole-3-glycerol-phosphate synthase TrpC/phosphoribosylanthranilate isomerase TrpF [Gammaproteobacteria bacterium]
MAADKNVLASIVAHKREEVLRRRVERPLASFVHQLRLSSRSLADALAKPGNRFIMEYKRASPSKGLIRSDFSPRDCLKAYTGAADAISVLTDEQFFSGRHEFLQTISKHGSLPVLCKDFFIDTYQVYEARDYGADAILLMLSVLTDEEYLALSQVAEELNMDVLTEVHTRAECERAVTLNAKIIGINNRDLRTLSIDLSTTEALAPLIPSDRLIISESGINGRADVTRLAAKVDGFLVGSSLMSQPDVALAARRLVFGSVKICGIDTLENALVAVSEGAEYLGIMCYPNSPRYLTIDSASVITRNLNARFVGVFVDADEQTILHSVAQLNLSGVQLHGNESLSQAAQLKALLAEDVVLWKALSLAEESDIKLITQWLQVVDAVVIDYQTEQVLGGTGQSFDWRLLPALFERVDREKIIIAGGINANNITQLAEFSECTIDLSSGVEQVKGKKDAAKISAFMHQCRMNGVKQVNV